jgi:hypothetical protein
MEHENYFEFVDDILMQSAEKILYRDTAIGMYSQADTFLDIFADGGVRVGNSASGAPTTYLNIEGDGDTYWVGDGTGLPYGDMYQVAASTFTVTMTNQNEWYEVNAATTNINAGELNLVTFPDDHYLQISKPGIYLITYSFTGEINSVAGGDQHIEAGIMVNGTIVTDKGSGHATYAAVANEWSFNGHTYIDLTGATDQVSLAIRNTSSAGKILTIDHLNMTVGQTGGT